MIAMLRRMAACRWAARRIQRYLYADPAALLSPADIERLLAHVAECARCARRAQEYRDLALELHQWARRLAPDPQVVARTQRNAERIAARNPL